MNAPSHHILAEITPENAGWPLGNDLSQKLQTAAADLCDSAGGCHAMDHAMRVHNIGLYIGRKMSADLAIISAAAILHDIGRRVEMRQQGAICHAAKGAELARPILENFAFSEHDIRAIVHCIASHRYRGTAMPLSLEAKILFDADKLDSIGATGIGRAFLFAGQVGARLHNPDNCIAGTTSYSTEDTAYREFKVKLCRVKEKMLTPVGKQLALERHHFMTHFFERLKNEITGEWLEQ